MRTYVQITAIGLIWLAQQTLADPLPVDSRPDLDYFPSRLHAAIFRNWDIVRHERLAMILKTDAATVRKAGKAMGLTPPVQLTPEEIRRNVEIVIRRNWPLMPRSQIEGLLGYTAAELDDFLGKEIFLRALLACQPEGLTLLTCEPPDERTKARTEWFGAHVRKHLKAVADTPEEPRLAYIKELCEPHHPGDFIRGTKPRPADADLRAGWRIQLPEQTDDVLKNAVQDFTDYCEQVQRVRKFTASQTSEGRARHSVRAGERSARNGAHGMTRPTIWLTLDPVGPHIESYYLGILSNSITLRSGNELGLARGLIELERRMAERGGPFLAPTAETNTPAFSPRYVSSYFSLLTDVLGQDLVDPFPDGYLNELRHQDADGIWVYTLLQDLVPSPVFEGLGQGSEARRRRLRDLVTRAGKYGLKVYIYLNEPRAQFLPFFEKYPDAMGQREGNTAALCTSTALVQKHLRGSFEKLFREVPGLGGVFVITASENLSNCYAHTRHPSCPRCKGRKPADVIAEVIRCMAEGAWAADPQAQFIVWDWSWHSVLGEDAPDEIIKQLPGAPRSAAVPSRSNSVASDADKFLHPSQPASAAAGDSRAPNGVKLMADFERGTRIERGGMPMNVEEYAISVIGPSPRAKLRSEQARQHGLAYFAKIQLSTTWECGTVPFIPVPNLLARKAVAMREAGVTGAMATWTIGSYPSPNTEAFALAQWNPTLNEEEILCRIAAKRYGPTAVESAVRGWTKLSNAFTEEFPYSTAPYAGPLQHGPSLPLYRRDIPQPYGHVSLFNCKDDWKRWTSPYSPELMTKLLRHLCDRWDDGMKDLRAAMEQAPAARRRIAERDLGVAWMVGYTYRAYANALDFYKARDTGDTATMKRIAAEEIKSTEESLRRVRADSRFGWEAELQYFYRPLDVLERLLSLDAVVEPMP